MKIKKIIGYIALSAILVSTSCDEYLDIVPDNIATLENAFAMRATAERFLFTCYSWIPPQAGLNANPGFMAGDEFWSIYGYWNGASWRIARGEQNVVNPLVNYWDGEQTAVPLFRGIRECNIFLENINSVPDMTEYEKKRWISEAKFLKAYFHFWLLRMYGPIPIVDTNLPISANVEEVKAIRRPVDECFDYIIGLIDESMDYLPPKIEAMTTEAGRIDKAIAKSVKAYILVTAASPLFNGNSDYSNFIDKESGKPYFNQEYDRKKWEKAVLACKEAIELCDSLGFQLYKFDPGFSQSLAQSTITQMSIRNSVCEKWNSEVIWGNPNSLMSREQNYFTPRGLDPNNAGGTSGLGVLAPTLKMAHIFYSKNGVPINEDNEWDYNGRFNLKVVNESNQLNLIKNYTTAKLNFDREDRYYASLGFDGGVWYGQGKYDDKNTWNIQGKLGQPAGVINLQGYSVTGLYAKKLVHYMNIIQANTVVTQWYSWPVIRLADLYLLYAESLNELNGPSENVYYWLDLVRKRAGLKGVVESWTNYSNNPSKYTTKEGLREIIQQERGIELAFEGARYWDLRRWKLAQEELNGSIQGWDVQQKTAETYYRPVVLFERTFALRDYLWPIKENSILVNRKLQQNPGWDN